MLLWTVLSILFVKDFTNGFILKSEMSPMSKDMDPELTAGYFEGDMVLPTDSNRNGLRDTIYRWPDNTVYYKFFTKFDNDHRNYILRGMRMIESISCIRFKEANDVVKNYVNISGEETGCFSAVGWTNSGAQAYNLELFPLDEGCFRLGTIVHEFLHTLGFFHMQSAANRDDYVRIVEENIIPVALGNFKKFNDSDVDHFDAEYDYGSILHYSAYAFSSNGEKTIIPIKDASAIDVMGQRRSMKQTDINKLNMMYRCPVEV